MAPKAKKAIRLPTTKPGPSPLTSSDMVSSIAGNKTQQSSAEFRFPSGGRSKAGPIEKKDRTHGAYDLVAIRVLQARRSENRTRGRPPLLDQAMSGTERCQRWRASVAMRGRGGIAGLASALCDWESSSVSTLALNANAGN
jgi:hypothetical protein